MPKKELFVDSKLCSSTWKLQKCNTTHALNDSTLLTQAITLMPCNVSFATSLILRECFSRPSSFPEAKTAVWKEQDPKHCMALFVHPQAWKAQTPFSSSWLRQTACYKIFRVVPSPALLLSIQTGEKIFRIIQEGIQNSVDQQPAIQILSCLWSITSVFFWNCFIGKHHKIKFQYSHKLQIKLFSSIASISSVCLDLCV